jgi:hypothetical protein
VLLLMLSWSGRRGAFVLSNRKHNNMFVSYLLQQASSMVLRVGFDDDELLRQGNHKVLSTQGRLYAQHPYGAGNNPHHHNKQQHQRSNQQKEAYASDAQRKEELELFRESRRQSQLIDICGEAGENFKLHRYPLSTIIAWTPKQWEDARKQWLRCMGGTNNAGGPHEVRDKDCESMKKTKVLRRT